MEGLLFYVLYKLNQAGPGWARRLGSSQVHSCLKAFALAFSSAWTALHRHSLHSFPRAPQVFSRMSPSSWCLPGHLSKIAGTTTPPHTHTQRSPYPYFPDLSLTCVEFGTRVKMVVCKIWSTLFWSHPLSTWHLKESHTYMWTSQAHPKQAATSWSHLGLRDASACVLIYSLRWDPGENPCKPWMWSLPFGQEFWGPG